MKKLTVLNGDLVIETLYENSESLEKFLPKKLQSLDYNKDIYLSVKNYEDYYEINYESPTSKELEVTRFKIYEDGRVEKLN